MKRALFAAAALVLGLLVTLALAEGMLRALNPTPRVQIVRPGVRPGADTELAVGVSYALLHGAPTWPSPEDAPRHHWECLDRPEASPRVLVLGSSILAASGLTPEEAFSVDLEARLRAEGLDPCVMNLSEGAYTFQSQRALAEEYIPKLRPDLVIWEVWENSPHDFSIVDGAAWRFQGMRLRGGLPDAFGLPPAVAGPLFRASRLYQYAAVALGPTDTGGLKRTWIDFGERRVPEAEALVARGGADLLWVFCPRLDRPFAESAAERHAAEPPPLARHYADAAVAMEAPRIYLEDLLVDDRVEDLRQDTCCHYAPAGQRRLAEVLAPLVLEAVSPSGAAETPAPPPDPAR